MGLLKLNLKLSRLKTEQIPGIELLRKRNKKDAFLFFKKKKGHKDEKSFFENYCQLKGYGKLGSTITFFIFRLQFVLTHLFFSEFFLR